MRRRVAPLLAVALGACSTVEPRRPSAPEPQAPRVTVGPLSPLDPSPADAFAFSPDSGALAIAGTRVVLVPLAGGQPRILATGRERVRSLAFSPGGTMLATAAAGSIRLWSVAEGVCERVLAEGLGDDPRLAISPDGALLACSSQGTLRLWDVSHLWALGDSKPVGEFRLGARGGLLSFSSDGRELYGTVGDRVVAWPMTALRPAREIARNQGLLTAMCPATGAVALGGWSARRYQYLGHGYQFAPENQRLLTCVSATVRSGAAETNFPLDRMWESCTTRSLAFSPDGALVAAGVDGFWGDRGSGVHAARVRFRASVEIGQTADGRCQSVGTYDRDDAPTGEITALTFSPDGSRLALSDSRLGVRICTITQPAPPSSGGLAHETRAGEMRERELAVMREIKDERRRRKEAEARARAEAEAREQREAEEQRGRVRQQLEERARAEEAQRVEALARAAEEQRERERKEKEAREAELQAAAREVAFRASRQGILEEFLLAQARSFFRLAHPVGSWADAFAEATIQGSRPGYRSGDGTGATLSIRYSWDAPFLRRGAGAYFQIQFRVSGAGDLASFDVLCDPSMVEPFTVASVLRDLAADSALAEKEGDGECTKQVKEELKKAIKDVKVGRACLESLRVRWIDEGHQRLWLQAKE